MNIGFFGCRLLARVDVLNRLVCCLLWAVESERNSQEVDRQTVRRLLRMLFSVGLYDRFEAPMLLDSQRFFSREGQSLLDSLDTAGFCVHVERRLQQAADMASSYLDVSSKPALVAVIDAKLLLPHVPVLLERGLAALLAQVAPLTDH